MELFSGLDFIFSSPGFPVNYRARQVRTVRIKLMCALLYVACLFPGYFFTATVEAALFWSAMVSEWQASLTQNCRKYAIFVFHSDSRRIPMPQEFSSGQCIIFSPNQILG